MSVLIGDTAAETAIRFDVPLADYLAIPALSSGVAYKALKQSPAHGRYAQLNRSDNSKACDVGSIAHQILLEGHENNIVHIDAKDWRTNAAKEQRDEAYASGKLPLLVGQINEIRTMVNAAKMFIAQSEIADVFGTGHPEVSVTWYESGTTCKARPDYLAPGWHISLKTTAASADPSGWSRRQLASMGYDFSLAFYDRGLKAHGVKAQHRLLVIEQNPPHGCCLVALDTMRKEVCEKMVEQAIRLWKSCEKDEYWPAYSTETHWAEMAPWELADAEERMLGEIIL